MRNLGLAIVGATAMLLASASVALGSGAPIMPLSQVQPGMDCTGETVVQGTAISSFNVHVIDIVQDPFEGPRILIRVSGPAVPAGVAEGFSGSPIYCPTGMGQLANAGAISESVGEWGNDVALATPIQVMLGEPVTPPASAARFTAKAKPLLGPLTVGGLSPSVISLVQRAAQRAGRLVLAAPARAAASFPVQPLVPGASVAASYSSGAIAFGGVGTVTYTNGSTIYAFGHELDGAGRRSLLLQDAYVYYVVNNPFDSYKLAAPGHTLGTLTSDTPNAVIGVLGLAPQQVPIDVTAIDQDTGHPLALHTQVADETDVGLPLGSSLVDLIAPIEVAQAATQVLGGAPASQSGHMCLQIFLREASKPLGFCNRYTGTGGAGDGGYIPGVVALDASGDVGNAFSLLEQVQFAKLHVTRVVAHLYERRGASQAMIIATHAPARVRAGQRVKVRLTIRVFRGALRTIPLVIQIPKTKHGRFRAVIHSLGFPGATNPGPGAGNGIQFILTELFGGNPFGRGGAGPGSIGQLRRAIAHLVPYDGLLLSSPGRKPRRIYRDPKLLITGRAALVFQVR